MYIHLASVSCCLTDDGELPNHLVHAKLIHRMDNIWPLASDNQFLIVQKVDAKQREELTRSSGLNSDSLTPSVMDVRGFSEVIQHLSDTKKVCLPNLSSS